MSSQVKIRIVTNKETETVWAIPQKKSLYKIVNTPFFAYGISWGDIIEAKPDSTGILIFNKIVKKSGNRTIRVADPKNDLPNELIEGAKKLGCSVEGANRKYICIDIPPKVEIERVINYLSSNGYQWEHADPTYEEYHSN